MNTTTTIAYKVLCQEPSGKLISANWSNLKDSIYYKNLGLIIEYKKGELVIPVIPNSKLFVFKYIRDALNYKLHDQVWEVSVDSLTEAIEPENYKLINNEQNQIPLAWDQHGNWITTFSSLFENSYLCNNLRLIKRLH